MVIMVDDFLPKYSLDVSDDLASQHLSMTVADFPNFGTTFTVYMRAKFRENPSPGVEAMFTCWNATQGERRFYIRRNGNDRIRFQTAKGGICSGMICSFYQENWIASTTTITDSDWHSFLFQCDGNNSTAADRLKMWIDGTLETPAASSFTWQGNRWNATTGGLVPGPMMIGGAQDQAWWGDMEIYSFAFAGGLHDLDVFENADGTLKDIRDNNDIDSYLWLGAGDPTEDFKIGTAWTNNNGCTVNEEIKDDAI